MVMGRPSELARVREAITAAGIAGVTIERLRTQLAVSESCVRKHLATLRAEGWLVEDKLDPANPGAGRPRKVLIDRRFR